MNKVYTFYIPTENVDDDDIRDSVEDLLKENINCLLTDRNEIILNTSVSSNDRGFLIIITVKSLTDLDVNSSIQNNTENILKKYNY